MYNTLLYFKLYICLAFGFTMSQQTVFRTSHVLSFSNGIPEGRLANMTQHDALLVSCIVWSFPSCLQLFTYSYIVHVPNLPTGDNLFVSENAPFRSLCWARIGSIRLWIAMFKYHEVVSGRQFGPQLPSFFEVNSVTVALPLSKTRRELIFGQVASVLLGKQWPVAAAKPWGGGNLTLTPLTVSQVRHVSAHTAFCRWAKRNVRCHLYVAMKTVPPPRSLGCI